MSAPVEAQPTCALNAMQLVAEFDLFLHDPAHRFRFVIGHSPGESEKLSLCHRRTRILRVGSDFASNCGELRGS